VQRSLLRNAWPGLAVDGADSALYRRTLVSFQNENGLENHGQVDEATQNQLIRLNHADPDYTAWVQAALMRAGLLEPGVNRAEPIMDRPASLTRQALRRWQAAQGLKADGWVGPKTELALMTIARTAPPADSPAPAPCRPGRTAPPPPPPAAKPDALLAERLRAVRVEGLSRDARTQARLACLRSFLIQGLTVGGVDDRYWQFRVFDGSGSERDCRFTGAIGSLERRLTPQKALANLKRCAASAHSPDALGRCLKQVHDAVLCSLNALLGWALHQSALGEGPIRDFPECAWALELVAASRRKSPRSVYACFAALLAPLQGTCR
jgi:hypothetical protein